MALQKRPAPVGMGATMGDPWDDPPFKHEYPALYSFLYDTKYADGTTRVTGSLSVFVNGYSLKMAVNDKDRGCVAFVTAPTWSELLAQVDNGIATDALDWKAANKGLTGKVPPF